MSEFLTYTVAEGVATLTINRPKKRNAMTFALLSALSQWSPLLAKTLPLRF
jgi:enoyl-CoA hydratase/carnithine racemase